MTDKPTAADVPQNVLDSMARGLMHRADKIAAWFEDPEVQRRFEAWKAQRKEETV